MAEIWAPPDGLRRKTDIITVPLGMFKGSTYRCPAADALKARGYCLQRPVARSRELLDHFAFGPFMSALGGSRGASPAHDGLQQWTEHAVAMYHQAFPSDPAEPMTEVPEPWIYQHSLPAPDHRGAREYRLTVWGRCLQSADGVLRELRLPVNRLSSECSDQARTAAAALVLAEGGPGPLPERVRVVEFALFDGCVRLLFEGTRTEAVESYRTHGSQALAALLDSQEYRPGTACGGCAYVSVCPALRKAPGLLGVDTPGRPRRTWSVTNGRNYRVCPARDHLRRLHLPAADAIERGPFAERGRALHAYLAERHGHGSLRPCTADVPSQWVPDAFTLSEEERRLGALLLRRHAAVCPLRCVRDRSDLRAEPRVVRHDTTADVIVVAAPDLLYRDDESWVWRETKTSMRDRRTHRELLDEYPQLALAVLLVGRGYLGGSPSRARIELEVLRPAGADLETVDPFAPAVRAAAQRVVGELTGNWHRDDRYAATPGSVCARCEMARWCSVGGAEKAAA
ncbi:PD-(D/E)XK nuclease family protein [Streptomyces sp. NPDC050610]|uniref:PD-(D/E)XK nuclease family protein n=1 Tax=Streptomyces sp. NPDC050610 TaxID=3157097 RepID=UPI00341B83A2